MADQESFEVSWVGTCDLKSGYRIISAMTWQVMIPSGGLVVDRVEPCSEKGCHQLYFVNSSDPEHWGSHFSWLIGNKCWVCPELAVSETDNRCEKHQRKEKEHGPTEEEPLR